MNDQPKDWAPPLMDGVYPTPRWPVGIPPQASENAAKREVLLVDKYGQALIVREPRPVGFRRP